MNPAKGPAGPKSTGKEKFVSLKYLWGVFILVVIVLGGIFTGFITITEAGAPGAFAALVVGFINGKMGLNILGSF